MADQEDEDLQMALRLSMQHSPPEPKRSRPRDAAGAPVPSPEASRQMQRELMAAAAEKRMLTLRKVTGPASPPASTLAPPSTLGSSTSSAPKDEKVKGLVKAQKEMRSELSSDEASKLFSMVFGSNVSKGILAQWTNQGIR